MRLFILLSLFILSNTYMNINMYGTGMFLPYSMGIVGYIKKHFPQVLSDVNITGISGGAICSILYTQEDDLSNPDNIWDYTIGPDISELLLYKDLHIFQKWELNLTKILKNFFFIQIFCNNLLMLLFVLLLSYLNISYL